MQQEKFSAPARCIYAWVALFVWMGGCISEADENLARQLGCAACHGDLKVEVEGRRLAPDLSHTGARYNSAWIFEFLQRPVKVRHHIGSGRMPSFHFDEKEALALTLFLQEQRGATRKAGMPENWERPLRTATRAEFEAELASGLVCLTCHKLEGNGGAQGIELSTAGYRLRAEWIREYLVDPAHFGVPPEIMPQQFFKMSPDGKSYVTLVSNAVNKINVVAGFLASLNLQKKQELQKQFQDAKIKYPAISAGLGRTIFESQNCAGCHRHSEIKPKTQHGPLLTQVASRVNDKWLREYLTKPHASRPFGFNPGDGSRMPDFRLSAGEVNRIANYIGGFGVKSGDAPKSSLSVFSQKKAEKLLQDKLACLGCHELNGKGGKIGPSFDGVGSRLRLDYLVNVIADPRKENPHTIMPQPMMPRETLKLISNYLAGKTNIAAKSRYLSLADHPVILQPVSLYQRECGSCHGPKGDGDGFNARYLPVEPSIHSSAPHMALRANDTLFDGVHSGGAVLNKHHYMPGFGASLSDQQIKGLVAHIRALCKCKEPDWAKN